MRSRLLFGIVGPVALAVACGQSDAGITTAVKTRLAADDTVAASQIDVDTRSRVVTLSGEVGSAAEETQALEIARSTDGVTDVVDQINIVPRDAVPTSGVVGDVGAAASDATITAAVKTKLLADPDVSGLKIDVDTKDRTVTLTGTTHTQAEKDDALAIARGTDNVVGVVDSLTIERR